MVTTFEVVSLINSDPCPDNLILEYNGNKISKLTMIDLDTFTFFSPFIDIYYLWIRATCWCVGEIEDEIIQEMEKTYLHEIRKYIEISDQYFYINLFLAGLTWTIFHLQQTFHEHEGQIRINSDHIWGRATYGQRFQNRLSLLQMKFNQLQGIIDGHRHFVLIKEVIETLSKIQAEFSELEGVKSLTKYPAFDT